MSNRLPIDKTYKLFIGGAFPRTESGRSIKHTAPDGSVTHLCHASRKDLRNAVEPARAALPKWAGATAYLRGQVLYRLAEMAEGKKAELAAAIGGADAQKETETAIDRMVTFAGWTDKINHVLGAGNQVAGPYYNFTVPEPTGVVFIACPDDAPLLGLVALTMPIIAAGATCVALASETNPVPAMILAEAIATSDLPGGVLNILTGYRDELLPHAASHRGIDAISAAGVTPEQATTLRQGSAENLKRVTISDAEELLKPGAATTGPWAIEPYVEMKTIWHPSAT